MEDSYQQTLDELRRKNTYLELLQEVTVAANESTEVGMALQSTLERICQFTGWPVGHVFLTCADDPDTLYSAPQWYVTDPSRYGVLQYISEELRFTRGQGLPGRILESGRPAWIVDIGTDGNFPRLHLSQDLGVKAAFGFPVLAGRKVVAVLEFFSDTTTPPDMPFLEVMAQVGLQIGRVFERQWAQEALQASGERLRVLTETAIDAIVTANQEGFITDWNRGAERMFGFSKAEAMGASLTILMPTRYASAHDQGMARLNAGGDPHVIGRTVELHGRRKDGEEFPIELSLFRWQTQQQTFYSSIIRDITIRKQAEEEILSLNAALVQRNRELQEFAYVASHDLQEPLRKIRTFSDLILKEYSTNLEEDAIQHLKRIEQAATRMTRLINDLLDFSRVATHGGTFQRIDMDLLAARVVEDLEGACEEVDGQITVEPLPPLIADMLQMRQLLHHLVSNGLKYRQEGVPPRVHVSARMVQSEGGAWYQLIVRDNGIGFDEKYRERIFKPFQRLHSRERFAGTGMGLAICRRIAERHGGQILAHSTPQQGSTFIVELPLRDA